MLKPTGFVIFHAPLGGYIEKIGGMNIGHRDPRLATVFTTREAARDARPGHHRDMGGAGFVGSVVPLATAIRNYEGTE